MLKRVGVSLVNTGDLSMEEIVQYAQEAEELGYEGFWVGEGDGKESFAVLAAVASGTKTLSLGTGDVNYYSRTPTLLAIGAATISRLSNGRFLHYGIGTGGGSWMEAAHGIALDRPVQRASEMIDILRGILTPENDENLSASLVGLPSDAVVRGGANRRFTYPGKIYPIYSFRLREGPVAVPPAIYLSALGPKMIALAAKKADGVISNGLSEASYYRYREIFEREAPLVGRDPNQVQLYTLTMTTADDSAESLAALRICLTYFFGAPHFAPIMEASGYGVAVQQLRETWRTQGILAASNLVTDDMMQQFAVVGSPTQRAQKMRWMLDRNIYPILYPVCREGHVKEDCFTTMRYVAQYMQEALPASTVEKSNV
ncbi:putative luciferase-like oxidoreductase [Tengunoibacter tsumagoiensis]|uniref:Putative luciferase-like oxidoreductase n=2 Tax=Tengunoibacter tsumagoiensis TaxID=2014871 RepID=A0A402A9J1_9CHLR|nr:putative luciferase-like oxidoreductase [Tengunoibacter tsumagoiensis]